MVNNEFRDNSQFDEDTRISKRNKRIAVVSGAILVAILVVCGGVLFKINMDKNIKTIVKRQVETYAADIGAVEAEQLTQTLTDKIEAATKDIGNRELTEAEMQAILEGVMLEMDNAGLGLNEAQIKTLSSEIMKQVLSATSTITEQQKAEYEAQIAALSQRISLLEARNHLTEQQVITLIKQYGLTEEEIIALMEKNYPIDVILARVKQMIGEDVNLDEVYAAIAKNKNYTDDVKASLASRIGVNETDIKNLGNKDADLEKQLKTLADKIGISKSELEKLIASSSELTKEEILKLKESLKSYDTKTIEELTKMLLELNNTRSELLKMIELKESQNNSEITKLKEQVNNNYTLVENKLNMNLDELKSLLASKEELEKAREALAALIKSMTDKGNASDDDLQKQFQAAIDELNKLINKSSDEDAKKIEELKKLLENSQADDKTDLLNQLKELEKALGLKANEDEAKIAELKSVIEQLKTELQKEMDGKIDELQKDTDDKINNINKTISNNIELINKTVAYKTELENVFKKLQLAINANDSNNKETLNLYIQDAISRIESLLKDATGNDRSELEHLLNQLLAIKDGTITSTSEINDILRAVEEALTGRISDANSRIDDLNSTVTAIDNRLTGVTNDLVDKTAELNETKATKDELEELQKVLQELDGKSQEEIIAKLTQLKKEINISIENETGDRQNMYVELKNLIDWTISDTTNINNGLTILQNTVSENIDNLEAELNKLKNTLTKVQMSISSNEARIDQNERAIASELIERAEEIKRVDDSILSTNGKLNLESEQRKQAVNDLTKDMNDKTSTNAASIGKEITDRANAIRDLTDDVNTKDRELRNTIENSINSEISSRSAADNNLQGQLNSMFIMEYNENTNTLTIKPGENSKRENGIISNRPQ